MKYGKGWDKGWDKPQRGSMTAFPAYDAIQHGEPKAKAKPTRKGDDEVGDDMLTDLQKAVNAARKAEHRLQKLVGDRKQAKEQWTLYTQKAKQAFIKEKTRHLKALDVFERDILVAQQAQQDARELICLIADGATLPVRAAEEAQDNEWEQMIVDWEEERRGITDGVVQRALQERRARMGPPAFPAETMSRGGGPDMASTQLHAQENVLGSAPLKEAKPMYGAASPSPPGTRSTPYPPTSPVLPKPSDDMMKEDLDRRTSPLHPGQRAHGQQRSFTDVEPPRQGVKEATKQPPTKPDSGGATLRQKLEERRAQEIQGSAMQPFRVASPEEGHPSLGSPGGAKPSAPATAPGPKSGVNILEDDDPDFLGLE